MSTSKWEHIGGDCVWESASAVQYEDCGLLKWRIEITDEGLLECSGSPELTDKRAAFPTFAAAVAWCEEQEAAIVAELSKVREYAKQ